MSKKECVKDDSSIYPAPRRNITYLVDLIAKNQLEELEIIASAELNAQ